MTRRPSLSARRFPSLPLAGPALLLGAAAVAPSLAGGPADAPRGAATAITWTARGDAAPADEAVLVGGATSPALLRLAHGRPLRAAAAIDADVLEGEGDRRGVAAALRSARFIGLDLATSTPAAGERRVLDVALRMGVPIVIENADATTMKGLFAIGFDADAVVLRGRDGGRTRLLTVLGERRETGAGRTSATTSTAIVEEIDALLDEERSVSRGLESSPPVWAYLKQIVQIKESWNAKPANGSAAWPAGSVDVQFEVEQFASYNPAERYVRVSTVGPGFRPHVLADHDGHRGWFNRRASIRVALIGETNDAQDVLDRVQLRDYAPKNVNGENSVTTETGVDFNLAFGLDKTGGNVDLLSFHDSKSYTYSFQDMEGLTTSAEFDRCELPLWELVGEGPCPITAPAQEITFDSELAALGNGEPFEHLYEDGDVAPLPALAMGDLTMNVQAVWATQQPESAPHRFRFTVEHDLFDADTHPILGSPTFAQCSRIASTELEIDWNAVTAVDPGFAGTFVTSHGVLTLEKTYQSQYQGTLETAAGPLLVKGERVDDGLKGELLVAGGKKAKEVGGFTIFLKDDSMALEGKMKWTKAGKKKYAEKKKKKKELWLGDRVEF